MDGVDDDETVFDEDDDEIFQDAVAPQEPPSAAEEPPPPPAWTPVAAAVDASATEAVVAVAASPAPDTARGPDGLVSFVVTERVYESQRFASVSLGNQRRGWSHKNLQNLGYGDPKRLSAVDPADPVGDAVLDALKEIVKGKGLSRKAERNSDAGLLNARWEWLGPWRIVRAQDSGTDAQGWQYLARLALGQSWSPPVRISKVEGRSLV